MRTSLLGATLVTAFLLPVTPVSAQSHAAATPGDHAAQATAAPMAAACCGDHSNASTRKAGCCADHQMAGAKTAATKADCRDHQEMAAMAAGRGAEALPADDPAVAIAGLGLSREFQFGGSSAAHGLPAVR